MNARFYNFYETYFHLWRPHSLNDSAHKDSTKTQLDTRVPDDEEKIPIFQDIQGELKNPIRASPATLLVIIRRWRGSERTSLASRVVNEGTLAEWNACQNQGPINIPWHPIDFSKWVPFLICKSSWWCFMLCLSLCIQCALSTFKFLLFPSNNHTQSTIYLNTPQLTEAFEHEAYKTFPLQEAGRLRKLVQITVMKMDRGTSWTVTRPRIECWSVLRLVQAGSS